jgi:hypothetical protein
VSANPVFAIAEFGGKSDKSLNAKTDKFLVEYGGKTDSDSGSDSIR